MSNWISVKDRLPEHEKWVLINTINNYVMIGFLYIDDTKHTVWGLNDWRDNPVPLEKCFITHWQPLPQPPEK